MRIREVESALSAFKVENQSSMARRRSADEVQPNTLHVHPTPKAGLQPAVCSPFFQGTGHPASWSSPFRKQIVTELSRSPDPGDGVPAAARAAPSCRRRSDSRSVQRGTSSRRETTLREPQTTLTCLECHSALILGRPHDRPRTSQHAELLHDQTLCVPCRNHIWTTAVPCVWTIGAIA